MLHWLAGATITKYNKLGDLNNEILLSHSSGSYKSEFRVSAGFILLRTVKENLFLASCLASDGLLAIFGIPWLLEVSHYIFPVCMSDSKFPLLIDITTPVILD